MEDGSICLREEVVFILSLWHGFFLMVVPPYTTRDTPTQEVRSFLKAFCCPLAMLRSEWVGEQMCVRYPGDSWWSRLISGYRSNTITGVCSLRPSTFGCRACANTTTYCLASHNGCSVVWFPCGKKCRGVWSRASLLRRR